jgi:ferrous iron transport protein B
MGGGERMNILLVGNPNVGKSALFGHLTGVSVQTSNYPGTTVEFTSGYLTMKNEKHTVWDVPGIYRLDPESEAEKTALRMLEKGDVLVNVVDAANLERNLNLTLQLMEYGKPVILALNMWDDALKKGIRIDVKKLEKLLKVSVIPTNGLTGEGVKLLSEKCMTAKPVFVPKMTSDARWKKLGEITEKVQNMTNRKPTFIERLQDFTVHPVFGLPLALVVLFALFNLISFLGEYMTKGLEALFSRCYTPLILKLSEILGKQSFWHELLIGTVENNALNYERAMGVLTTGLFVSLGVVFPYILLFYIVFGFLEDLGYLPRVAVTLDKTLHRIGLHGYSVIPMFLACGCNVPGLMAIRNLETRRERFITAVLTCTVIPCMAQTSLIFKAVGSRGHQYILLVFLTLFTVWMVLGAILKHGVKDSTPTLIMEVPPYRMPRLKNQMKKVRMRLTCFMKDAVPYVFFGVFLMNVLHITGAVDFLGKLFSPLITGVFGLPVETVAALIVGAVRKDAALALLLPLELTDIQTVIAVVVLTLYIPCIATATILFKELGLKDSLKALGIMFVTTVVTGGGLNLLCRIYTVKTLLLVEPAVAYILVYIISSGLKQKTDEINYSL